MILLLFLLTSFVSFGQSLQSSEISNKKIVKFLESTQLEELRASCISLERCLSFEYKERQFLENQFRVHEQTEYIDASYDEVVNGIINASPEQLWSGDSRFVALYRGASNIALTKQDSLESIELGDIVLLELSIRTMKLKGAPIMTKIPVSFQIVLIDREAGEFAFSYSKANKSKGIQHIKIYRIDDKTTKIVHTSKYLSGNKFRDRYIYENFHQILLKDFYRNLESGLK